MPWCHTGLRWRVRRGSLPLPLPVPRRDVMARPYSAQFFPTSPHLLRPPRPPPTPSCLVSLGWPLPAFPPLLGAPTIRPSTHPSVLLAF